MAAVPLLLTLCCFAGVSASDAGFQLLHASVVYRHGDRSPQATFPSDRHGAAAWPQGFGALTELGVRQQLDLGRFLRKRYQDLINSTYVPSEVFVRSTGFDRTLQSAYSNLAGFYNTSVSPASTPNASWQPVPVHSVPRKQDTLFGLAPCKSRDRVSSLDNVVQSVEIRTFFNKSAELVPSLSSLGGYKKVSFSNLATISDSLYCQAQHNLSLPDWASWTNLTGDSNVTVVRALEELVDLVFKVTARETLVKRLSAGLLLNEITENMQKSVEKQSKVKLAMYSAHDSTIAYLLSALDAFDGKIPRYAALVTIELWARPGNNSATAVRVHYKNGVEVLDPVMLNLPGCPSQCSLASFKTLVSKLVPADYAAECEGASAAASYAPSSPGGKGTSFAVSRVITIFCGILLGFMWH